MFDILILENHLFFRRFGEGAPNFISEGGSDGLDLSLPILLYKSSFFIVDSFYSFKIYFNIAFNTWNYESNAKPIRFYVSIKVIYLKC